MPEMGTYDAEVLEEASIQIKYEGYIQKQQEEVNRFIKLEEKVLPVNLDYLKIKGLSNEARQRLTACA